MADQTIKFILETVDNASAQLEKVGTNISTASDKAKLALVGIGVAATGALAVSLKAYVDEEAAITKAARATEKSAGGYEKARAAMTELNKQMEAQGFQTEDTTAAVTLLVNKFGMDFPTATQKAGDLLAYAANNNLTLQRAVMRLTDEEKGGIAVIEGSSAARLKNLSTTDRMAIAQEKFNNLMEKVGERLLPIAEKALAFATIMMDAFEKLDPALQEVVIIFGIIVAVIASVVGAVTGLAMAFGPIISLFAAGGPLAGIAATIGGAVAAIASLLTGVGEIILIIAAIIAILAIFKAAWDSNFMGIQQTLGPIIDWITQNVGLVLTGAIMAPLMPLIALKAAWDTNFLGIQDTVTNVITTIQGVIQAFIDLVFVKWTTWLANLVLGIVDFGVKVIIEVNKFVTGITTAFTNLIKKGLEWGAQLVSNVLQGISDKAKEIGDAVGNAASSAWNMLSGGTSGATGLVAQGVRPLADGGIITRPTMALLGEGGENEYVIPESKLAGLRGGAPTFVLNLNVAGNIDDRNRDFVVETVQQEFATLWRSVSR